MYGNSIAIGTTGITSSVGCNTTTLLNNNLLSQLTTNGILEELHWGKTSTHCTSLTTGTTNYAGTPYASGTSGASLLNSK